MDDQREIFFKVVRDLKDFLPNIVLVGGWVPYVYHDFVWENVAIKPHYTTDVDFGIDGSVKKTPKITIYDQVTKLKYPERHLDIGHAFPIIPLIKTAKSAHAVPLEFVCDKSLSPSTVQKIAGVQIHVNRLEYVDMLLSDVRVVSSRQGGLTFNVRLPTEEAFIFHKLVTFPLRDSEPKFAKDLYYVYYMLRFSPNKVAIDKKQSAWKLVKGNLEKYFRSPSSKGILLVEKEFGPDSIITDLRRHIWRTFNSILS